ncbi:ABC transporter ATP-binding protein [Agromyces mangrovi Wang et al. 2018]|uniref:ABC transporter ATP-binding protein n=1 Tax=Agromyces mangrovi TaxID=1858653 RepID=UPI002573EA56|nr:ABC transporter ATP-binding protein [Agromyces mangrovi]BDZ63581.1 ABC transporter ATP-binding protein [Agromyces mangrovi]
MSLLDARGLTAGYGQVTVLHDVSFRIEPGEIVVVLGSNGAGKTTLLRALSGLIPARGGLSVDDVSVIGTGTHRLAALGMAHVPQGRGTFGDLTVEENLLVGAATRPRREARTDLDRWYTRFPRLGERRHRPAAGLSGGEQQMLAIARGFMSRPRLVLLDEPSLGLAPAITTDLFGTLADLHDESGAAMLIVEQNAELALRIGERALLLEHGRIVQRGTADEFRSSDDIRRAYLGV